MARKTAQPTKPVWGRLTPKEIEALQRIADKDQRSLSFIVTRIIRAALPTLKDAA